MHVQKFPHFPTQIVQRLPQCVRRPAATCMHISHVCKYMQSPLCILDSMTNARFRCGVEPSSHANKSRSRALEQVEGTLSVQPQANPVVGFEEHFLGLTVENNRRNPWFVGKCSTHASLASWLPAVVISTNISTPSHNPSVQSSGRITSSVATQTARRRRTTKSTHASAPRTRNSPATAPTSRTSCSSSAMR